MSGLSHFRVVVFFPRVFSIVPCHYGQVSGVKVWLARKKSGIKILKGDRKKKNGNFIYCKFSNTYIML